MSNATTDTHAITTNRTVVCFAQLIAFVAAIAIFPMSLFATIKFASSPFEVFVGVVLAGILASAMVIIGLVTPSAVHTR